MSDKYGVSRKRNKKTTAAKQRSQKIYLPRKEDIIFGMIFAKYRIVDDKDC